MKMSPKIDLCYSSSNNTSYPIDTNDKEAMKKFRNDNPHLIGNFIPAGTPFVMRGAKDNNTRSWRESRPDLVCAFNRVQSLPPRSKTKYCSY